MGFHSCWPSFISGLACSLKKASIRWDPQWINPNGRYLGCFSREHCLFPLDSTPSVHQWLGPSSENLAKQELKPSTRTTARAWAPQSLLHSEYLIGSLKPAGALKITVVPQRLISYWLTPRAEKAYAITYWVLAVKWIGIEELKSFGSLEYWNDSCAALIQKSVGFGYEVRATNYSKGTSQQCLELRII